MLSKRTVACLAPVQVARPHRSAFNPTKPQFSARLRQRKVSAKALSQKEDDKKTWSVLNEGIANFYDQSTGLWEEMWGDHLHHGYYAQDGSKPRKTNREAQIDMVENVLSWADVRDVKKVRCHFCQFAWTAVDRLLWFSGPVHSL